MFLWGLYEQHTSHFWFLIFNSKNKISICSGREYLFSGKTTTFSLTFDQMPLPLLFQSSLWGTEKPFIKNWIDGKVLSNLVSDNTKISTYWATDIDSISNLLWMEFIFKWPVIERPGLLIFRKARCPGDEVVHLILFLFFLYKFNFVQEQLLKWNICRCWF